MNATDKEVAGQTSFRFKGIEAFSRGDVAVWNWRHRFFRRAADWRTWIKEAWQELLHVPAGSEILLSYQNTAETQQEPGKRIFKQREIFLGREIDNDIALPTLTVGKRHARIFVESGRCFLEDLGSYLGTYLNQTKLSPNRPHVVNAGDQIAIFPYSFSVSLRQLWAPEMSLSVHASESVSMTWREFIDFAPKGRTTFPIEVHPLREALCLEVNRAFLTDLVGGLLRPLDLSGPASDLTPTDSGFLEFLIVRLLERVNRDLKFPFQFDAGACGTKPPMALETRGIVMTCSVSLLATTGALRLFAPYGLLNKMRDAVPDTGASWLPSSIAWKFPVSLGCQSLTIDEATSLECEDVLLFQPEMELLMPGRSDFGWKISKANNDATVVACSNIQRIQIDKYFERKLLISGDLQPSERPGNAGAPDLSQLPVHVHVILAERELTLGEAGGLAPGTILELDRENSGHVFLAINGKISGEGQLVEVEGRLGVRISSWRAP